MLKDDNKTKVSYAGLKKILDDFDENGRYARHGNWSIASGAYDLWWGIYYKDCIVLQCINGELQGGFSSIPEFTEESERQLIEKVKRIYKDLK